jgi:hypothetical protein
MQETIIGIACVATVFFSFLITKQSPSVILRIYCGLTFALLHTATMKPQLLAEETFTYTTPSTLNGQGGGTGWGNVWWNQNADISIPGYNASAVFPMSYSGFLFQGEQMVGGDNFQSTGRILNQNAAGPFATYLVNGDGNPGDGNEIGQGNIWLGCMMRKNNNDNQNVEFILSDTDIYWDCTSNNKVSFGFFGAPSLVAGTRYWTMRLLDPNYYITNSVAANGTTFFFALNIRYNFPSAGTTSVSLFVDPPLSCTTPTLASVSATSTANLVFKNIGIYGSDGFNGANFDEIRIGGTYCDVVSLLTVLPIGWVSCNASYDQKDHVTRIDWKTAHETNCDYFEIELSDDGLNWQTIERVAGSGNSSSEKDYVYFHSLNTLNSFYYYRLKQVDTNGDPNYSKIMAVSSNVDNEVKLLFNKDKRSILIRGNAIQNLNILRVSDGLQLLHKDLNNAMEYSQDVNGLSAGYYIVEVITENGSLKRFKLLID